MKLYTIGFTQKTAEQFFDLLAQARVECVVDIRLHAGGQLAGFAKQEDLRFFLRRLNGCDYVHLDQLAPSEDILKAYRADHDWRQWEASFRALMDERRIPETLDRGLFERQVCCLLCSEPKPQHCHRRIVAERIAAAWSPVEVVHL